MLAKEYQEHEGAKDGSTLYVQYNYDDTAASGEYTKGMRQKSVRYPNARLVHFTYGSSGSDADNLNRLDAVNEDNGGSPGNAVTQYSYVGLGMIVIEDYPQPDVRLDYYRNDQGSGTSGTYQGFDRFDRVVNHKWYDYGASAVRDQYTYAYDRASNRLYRENVGPSGKDEFYTYDGMYQLKNFDRGDLNEGKTAISGTLVREEDFTLDPTGNWSGYVQKTSGTTQLNQSWTHNPVNEVTDISETTGPAWITPVQDRAGNMTTVPNPANLANGLTCVYDAWNRLVEVQVSQGEVYRCEYDGLNRRIIKYYDVDPYGEFCGYFYHNASWQLLEERYAEVQSAQPETLQPYWQYVWSARYIDSPLLRDKNTDTDGLCDDERLYYLGDANFNVTTLVDTGGEAVERYVYDPYGKVTIQDGSWSGERTFSSYQNEILYTGREFQTETALYYYRGRWYHPPLGRFLSRDRIGYQAGDSNLYRYVMNNPPRVTDPYGFQPPNLYGVPWTPGPVRNPPPPPFPGPGVIGPAIPVPGYWLYETLFPPFALPLVNPQPDFEPEPLPPGLAPGQVRGITSETGSRFAGPLRPGQYFGVGGCGTCVGAVIHCPGKGTAAFHFDVYDEPGGHLGKYCWPNGCYAVVTGGDWSGDVGTLVGWQSKDLFFRTLNALRSRGIRIGGYVGGGAVYRGADRWYRVLRCDFFARCAHVCWFYAAVLSPW